MSAPAARLCVVGSSNIDLIFRTARLPRPGETLKGQSFFLGYGGKGANQAVMAARLGARVAFIGRVGNDVFGKGMGNNLMEQGIDTTHLSVDPERASGTASITVDDEAQNSILVVPGANLGLSVEDVTKAATAIEHAQTVLGQLEVPLEATRAAFQLARSAGVRTILNPAPAMALPDELLSLCDFCIPNETELELLTGIKVSTLSQVERAAYALRQRGPATVITTLGERGALIVTKDAVEQVPSPAVQAVDSAGAGDAFIGSLAVYLVEAVPLVQAVRQANSVAALSVTRPGTQASFPTRDEVDAFQRNEE